MQKQLGEAFSMAAELKNIYLICGNEQYLKEKKKRELLKALKAEGSMNFNSFEGKDLDRDEVLRLADTMPMFEEHRTLLLADTGFFKGSAPEDMLGMLSELPESTVMLFYETEADKGNKLYKLVKERGDVFDYKKAEGKSYKEAAQDQGKIRTWALNYLKKNHREIGGRAMTRLLQLAGYDMLNLQSELDKLIAYTAAEEELRFYKEKQEKRHGAAARAQESPAPQMAGSLSGLRPTEIREADVEAICSKTLSDKVFDMLSAKLQGNIGTALRLYEEMLALKTPPMRVLYLLGRQFNQVYMLKELSGERIGDAALAEKMKIKDWQLRKLREQSSRLNRSEARKYLELCVEMETKIKQGDMNDKLGVEIILAS